MAKHITPEFRGSFVHLDEPKAPAEGADPVYSMAVVLPKEDPAVKKFMKDLKADIAATAKAKFGTATKKLKAGIKDGDEEDRSEWDGCWILTVKSKSRPGVVGADLKPIMDAEQLYSGAVYRVSLSPWAWSHSTGGKGVSYNLDNVMWVKDGDRFDNRATAESDFADFAAESANDEDADDDEELDFG